MKLYPAFAGDKSNAYNTLASHNGGDRLRQEPERSSRCMPGYLMQLVKTRRETQLPIMNWLSLPNKHRASRRKLLMRAE